ncbi:hypothetical protein YDYSG_01540 [Paenibacillus tyrfis]|uniref:hypothetical protein n=1 Tax=Paenibacillus tyrfis TaxID=1501230 RepID=UPI00249225E0|nr:hypothetical protein [Paenibacillus tyrfis]GLI04124.1 hypothetical protein YDYSG_01540 [Paenibacillus tyrfis]
MHRRWNGLLLTAILCLALVFAPVLLMARTVYGEARGIYRRGRRPDLADAG